MKKWTGIALAALLVAACGSGETTPESVQGPVVWGGTEVARVSHLLFSAQPDAETLERARAEGVTLVVNLRAPGESGFWEGEADAARALGLDYANVPVRRGEPFSPEAFGRVEALVTEREGEPILVHCSSANRAAAWLATHLVEAHGTDLETALEVARRAGMTKPEMESGVRRYLAGGS